MKKDALATKADLDNLAHANKTDIENLTQAGRADTDRIIRSNRDYTDSVAKELRGDIARLEKTMHEEFVSLAESIRDLAQMAADRFDRLEGRSDKHETESKLQQTILNDHEGRIDRLETRFSATI